MRGHAGPRPIGHGPAAILIGDDAVPAGTDEDSRRPRGDVHRHQIADLPVLPLDLHYRRSKRRVAGNLTRDLTVEGVIQRQRLAVEQDLRVAELGRDGRRTGLHEVLGGQLLALDDRDVAWSQRVAGNEGGVVLYALEVDNGRSGTDHFQFHRNGEAAGIAERARVG